jgi:hypothetical protein
MKGDFSRLTFAEQNHYRRVLKQQGRVEIDADGNEQVAIGEHLAATTATDVIGQAGYPQGTLPNGNPTGGFALGLNAAATDLTISTGRMYVDGLLVENDTLGATLLEQPDLPGATMTTLNATAAGIYAVYLDVWERLITALDNPQIRETALGGPDTSARTKMVWQIKLASLGAVPAAGGVLPTCASAGSPWPAPSTGMLAAQSGAPGSTLPCILPPETGYQQLENQLYRVEIHTPGADGTATFKWSRENGSVVALISSPATSGGSSLPAASYWCTSVSQDQTLGFQAGDWVEFSDDSTELGVGHGTLYQVAATPTDGHTVSLTATTAPTANISLHPKLRRWDQSGTGLDHGITVMTATPIPLEGGVEIQFSAGNYQVGDYWVIPARTATSVQQGFVDWPLDATSKPIPQLPAGIAHHYAKLGLVEVTATGTFAGLGTAVEPTDCRLPFPALTEITSAQSASPCTIVVQPGAGWEQPILSYFQNAGAGTTTPLNAEICFPVGSFPVTTPLVINNGGHIRISGSGWGTQLIAPTGTETVMRFEGCLSVGVRDLYGSTSSVTSARTATGRDHINGTLSFSNCEDVVVEDVWLRCGSAVGTRGASCITVSSDITAANATSGAGSARVRGCLLHVGEMQVGVQIIHQARAVVEDNEIVVDPSVPTTTLGERLADLGYLAAARKMLISSHFTVEAATAAAGQTPAAPTPASPTPATGAGGSRPAESAGSVAPTDPSPHAEAETAYNILATQPTPPETEVGAPGSTAPSVVRASTTRIPTLTASLSVEQSAALGGVSQPVTAAAAAQPTGEVAATAPIAAEQAVVEAAHPIAAEQPVAAAAAQHVATQTSPAASGDVVEREVNVGNDVLTAPAAALAKAPAVLTVGNQTLSIVTNAGLESTWQTYLNQNAPKTFATTTDAARFVKQSAKTILTTPAARAGFSGFAGIMHTLNQHVPLAGRAIVVGGQAIGDLLIASNSISGVLLGISVGVSHHASAAEAKAKQRAPDHMLTIRIIGNTVACSANDLASRNARFGVFVGSANSVEIEGNRVTLTPVGISPAPPADAIRVVGYLGLKTVVRGNYTTGFAMGIRVIPLTGNGPGKRAQSTGELNYFGYTQSIRPGNLWLVADNAIEGAAATAPIGPFTPTIKNAPAPPPYVDATACMNVNNVHT